MLLTGEPGIGKSRLVHALTRVIADDGPVPRLFQCSSFHVDSPFWPIVQQLSLAAAIDDDGDAPARRSKLARALDGQIADPERAAAVLMPPLGAPDDRDDDRDRRQRRRETVAILTEALLGKARTEPALIVFEDAQWADPATIGLLRGLVGAICEVPILLIVTSRAEGQPQLGAAPNLTALALPRLNRSAAAALLARITAERPLAARLDNEILARSDGIPLFIEEITRAVVEAAPAGETITVPATLRDSLIARLDGSPTMKATAQIAACFGRDFDRNLLETVADIAPAELRNGLAALLQAGLVVTEGHRRYHFRHALIRDIAYETLLTPRRRKLHQRIAETLEAMPGDRADSEPELLARHWFAAGRNAQAEAYWMRARHRAAYWQEHLHALAVYLDADATETDPANAAPAARKLH